MMKAEVFLRRLIVFAWLKTRVYKYVRMYMRILSRKDRCITFHCVDVFVWTGKYEKNVRVYTYPDNHRAQLLILWLIDYC